MKRFAWILGITLLLALALVAAGCSTATAPATKPAATTPAVTHTGPLTTTEGTITDVNPQKSTVTVETPTGPKAFLITPSTSITLNGKSCTLDQLDQFQATGADYDCTVVYDAEGNVAALNVYKITAPASVKGTISDVNIKASTITVKTAAGDKVYDVDADTGLIVGGVACSLELVNALFQANAELPGSAPLPCTVIVSTDAKGDALYVDINNPSGLVQGVGTVTKVDVQTSEVTLQTDKGPRTFKVNAKTGEFLNGEVCSLADVQAAEQEDVKLGLSACQVVYYTDTNGNLLYIDVSQQGPK